MDRFLRILGYLVSPIAVGSWLMWFLGSYYIFGYRGQGIITTDKV